MFNVESIYLKNFGTHENTRFNIKSGSVTIINGINNTDAGQQSNGSGKSFFIEGFIFALTGTPFRNVNTSELIRNGEKEAEVEVVLRRGKDSYVFYRKIFAKKSSSVQIFKNKEEIVCSSVKETDKKILEIVGLTKQYLIDYFLISKEKYTSFFTSSDREKKELINRFSKANLIDSVEDDVKADVDQKKQELEKSELRLSKLKSSLEGYKESLNDSSDSIEDLKNKDKQVVKELKSDIEECESELLDQQKQIDEKRKQIDEFSIIDQSEEISNLEKEKRDILETLNSLKESRKETQSMKKDCREAINELEGKLAGLIKCPKCEHNFSLSDKDFNEKNAKEQIKELKSTIEDLNEVFNENENDINYCEDQLSSIRNKIKNIEFEYSSQERELKQLKQSLKSIESLQSNTAKRIERSEDEIERINNKTYESKDEVIKERISSTKEKIGQEEQINKEIQESVFEINKWASIFKRFKGHLANSSLGSVEGYTNLYLDKLKSNIRVKFDGYKELKSGKVKESIDVTILKDGEEVGNFGKLSSGEKARVEVATILAINSLVNLSSDGGGLNIVMLDEILESLDGMGLDLIVEALQTLNQTIILITHGQVNTNTADKLTVVKENGISTLEYNN